MILAPEAKAKTDPLWSPSNLQIANSPMTNFKKWCESEYRISMPTHEDFHAWSVTAQGEFWSAVWIFCGVIGQRGQRALINDHSMLEARFFPDAKLNFAENLLTINGPLDALIFCGEDKVRYRWSWDHLHATVSKLQQAFRNLGIGVGDRVCAMMPNMPETIACMLAASSIGAVWSSCSPDFGEQGVLDRFGQITPKLFITCDAYWYNVKLQDVSRKVQNVAEKLGCPTIVVHYCGDADTLAAGLPDGQTFAAIINEFIAKDVEFVSLPFHQPLYIMFSSGTTGAPKCIVHSAGGTLLQHLKEHRFHCGVVPNDKLFYYTTCGWMMWNWLSTGLASGATLCLYDGSPFAPSSTALWDFAAAEKITIFGTSAKYIDAMRKAGLEPRKTHDLTALKMINSTGSPLSPQSFAFVYDSIKEDVHLASISGGTDIVSCFVLGNPVKPVWRGEIQGAGLGLAVDIWGDDGQPVRGEKGELVCTKPFPSIPLGFWNDDDGSKYRAAYFERFANVWCQGDFAEWTDHGGLIIYGRSDATLNPGGVRIGTSEIYNQVEQLGEVIEAVCIGQDWDDDVRVVLFVHLTEGLVLDDALIAKIKQKIRTGASPRHVPAKIIQVTDIPRTKSGKIVELAVREIVHGRDVKNQEALANPQALALFHGLEALKS